jgi:hypothetical protein
VNYGTRFYIFLLIIMILERWILNPFNENVTVAAELEVKIHDQLIELSADVIFF